MESAAQKGNLIGGTERKSNERLDRVWREVFKNSLTFVHCQYARLSYHYHEKVN